MTGRRGRKRKQISDDVKEKRGYFKLEEDAPHGSVCGELAVGILRGGLQSDVSNMTRQWHTSYQHVQC